MKAAMAVMLCLLAGSAWAEEFPLGCYYSPVDTEEGLTPFESCARRDGNTVRLSPEHFRRLAFDEDGLATFSTGDGMFYVDRQRSILQVPIFDNGADYFEEGLVRGLVNGKLGYYDKHLRQVIAPKYDWGTPFENGVASVGVGCSRSESDGDGHYSMGCDQWGVVDRTGKEIEPLR